MLQIFFTLMDYHQCEMICMFTGMNINFQLLNGAMVSRQRKYFFQNLHFLNHLKLKHITRRYHLSLHYCNALIILMIQTSTYQSVTWFLSLDVVLYKLSVLSCNNLIRGNTLGDTVITITSQSFLTQDNESLFLAYSVSPVWLCSSLSLTN